MKRRFGIITIVFMIALFIPGCYLKEASVIYKNTLQPGKLPSGSRVLLGEFTAGFATYEIKKFRKDIKLTELVIVDPPPSKYIGALLPELMKIMADDMNVDMIFLVRLYDSQQNYSRTDKKQHKETLPKRNNIRLTQVVCEVYQYDGRGLMIGHTSFSISFPYRLKCTSPCPSTIFYYDGFMEFKKWLKTNI